MLVCRECGSLQFSDVGRICPQCGSDAGFDRESSDYSHDLEDDDYFD